MDNIVKIDPSEPDPEILRNAGEIIKRGGIIAFPTDTFYGLGANPFDPSAIEKIFRLKKREEEKPILILINSVDNLSGLVEEITPLADLLIKHLWPGPLTIIFKSSSEIPKSLTSGTGKIGIRLPKNRLVNEFLKIIGIPITATSANISGNPDPVSAVEVISYFGDALDLILDAGELDAKQGSTIIDVSTNELIVKREGILKIKSIEAILRSNPSPPCPSP